MFSTLTNQGLINLLISETLPCHVLSDKKKDVSEKRKTRAALCKASYKVLHTVIHCAYSIFRRVGGWLKLGLTQHVRGSGYLA